MITKLILFRLHKLRLSAHSWRYLKPARKKCILSFFFSCFCSFFFGNHPHGYRPDGTRISLLKSGKTVTCFPIYFVSNKGQTKETQQSYGYAINYLINFVSCSKTSKQSHVHWLLNKNQTAMPLNLTLPSCSFLMILVRRKLKKNHSKDTI